MVATTLTREQRVENARKRAWLHDREQVLDRRDDFLELIGDQARAILKTGTTPCACCRFETGTLARLYRCFQCDLWLCPACARVHFPEVDRGR